MTPMPPGTPTKSVGGSAPVKTGAPAKTSPLVNRFFTKEGIHPYSEITWVKRDAVVGPADRPVFEQKDVEFPDFWSDNAVSITVSKYFRGKLGTPVRETSLRQMIDRVVRTIRGWGESFGYFADSRAAEIFADELTHLLLYQKASFNSPVWFNVGTTPHPQCSACFILSVEDNMPSILDWIKTEGMIFKGGSGSGLNLSTLRSKHESLSGGGRASGPVSFMRGADSVAGMIKSGGTTRRAAKMVVLNIDHPDIMDFINCKSNEEKKIKALAAAGFNMADLNDEAWNSIQFQNANNSVRLTDDFMRAVEEDGDWKTSLLTGGDGPAYQARELLRAIAQAAWDCGDPGVQFDTIINDWHTCPMTGRINASNPCFTGDTRVATNHGLITFKELYEKTSRGEEFKVMTDNRTSSNSDSSISYTVPVKVMVTGVNDVYKLTFSNGSQIKATKNHRFFTKNRGMVAAADLTPSDQVLTSTAPLAADNASLSLDIDTQLIFKSGWGGRDTKQFSPVKLPTVWTTDLAHYLGYLVGDGSVRLSSDNHNRLSSVSAVFGNQTEAGELIPQFTRLFSDWGVNSWQELSMPNGTVQLRLNRTPVARLLVSLGASTRKAPYKVLPESIFKAPESIQTAFLRGLFTADGCVYNGAKHRYVGLGSTSRTLLQQVQELLLSHGIFSRIYQNKNRARSSFTYINKTGQEKSYSSQEMFDLRISSRSISRFQNKIGFLTSAKQEKLNTLVSNHRFYAMDDETVFLRRLDYIGKEFTYNLTEPKNHSYIAGGFVVANCSEYMHLDDSACNLASINLMKFIGADGRFKVRDFKQAVDVFILAQDIIVEGSNYPTERITKNARAFRELGLGYSNMGALIMAKGYAYDSDEGRALAAAITSLLTGESYRQSALLSQVVGPFSGFAVNREPMLRVIAKHGAAASGIDTSILSDRELASAAANVWDEALALGKHHGFRNSQTTVIAPTGTISFMMDCDTTGVEPAFSLVTMKQLVGGGWMKLVIQGLKRALANLGYGSQETEAIVTWIKDNNTIEGAPYLKEEHLSIFDCAVAPANGSRSISWQGHVRMVGAVQPFVSGAISKTFNMSASATAEDILNAYTMAWRLGIKAFAVYRDGSKSTQPLNVSGEKKDADSESASSASAGAPPAPFRRRLPTTRPSETHKFSIAGHEGYLTYSMYEDGAPAEIFIRMAKQGSTLSGLLDAFAVTVSISLQYGVPLKNLAEKFIHSRFEPAGFTENPQIRIATSIIDYIFRYLALRFLLSSDLSDFGLAPLLNGNAHDVNPVSATPTSPVNIPVSSSPNPDSLPRDVSRSAYPGNGSAVFVSAGTVCKKCGGMMVRTGTCQTCLSCGTSSGGCS